MRDILEPFKKVVVYSVMAMIGLMIILIIMTVTVDIYEMITDVNSVLVTKHDILQFIGNFLLIVVCIELLDTLLSYAKKHEIHVEVVILVTLTAVARELIVTDYDTVNASILAGVGIAIAALATAYYLIRRSNQFVRVGNEAQ